MTTPELVIAVPAHKALTQDEAEWLKKEAEKLARMLPGFQVVVFVNQSDNLPKNLNSIVHEFMENKNAEWLWIAYPDLLWTAADVQHLVATKRPVIGVLTTACSEWQQWQLATFDDKHPDESGIVQVAEACSNGMLIHCTVFTRILRTVKLELDYRDDNSWKSHYAFFQQARVAFGGLTRLLTEWQFFSWLCRESATGIFVHTKIALKRKGPDGLLYPLKGEEPQLIPLPAPDASQWPLVKQGGKIVICLQYWEGDRVAAQDLVVYMASLETKFRHDVRLVLVGRHDAKPIVHYQAAELFFETVLISSDAHHTGYPQSPNFIAWSLMRGAASGATWAQGAKCILLMEPDCVPVARDWIDQLSDEWDRAAAKGKLLLGHWQRECGGHVNGNLMFSPELANVVNLGDKPTKRPWDISYPPIFQPHWARTGLIKNLYRRTDVKDDEMLTPACGTKRPVLIHGVRDRSAWNFAQRHTT